MSNVHNIAIRTFAVTIRPVNGNHYFDSIEEYVEARSEEQALAKAKDLVERPGDYEFVVRPL